MRKQVVGTKKPGPERLAPAPPATTYLSQGPALSEEQLARDHDAWRICDADRLEREGRRGGNQSFWEWRTFERAFVEGVISLDGSRRWPSLRELSTWSGCGYEVVKNRAQRDGWYGKRRVHEERLPALVEEAARRVVGEHIGDWVAAGDEAVAKKAARQYVREVAEPYLNSLLNRLHGKLEDDKGNAMPMPAPNIGDAEKLLKLLLLIEGEATERVAFVGAIQLNLNLQAEATIVALQECASKGYLDEAALPRVLETVQRHVSRVQWRYDSTSAEMEVTRRG